MMSKILMVMSRSIFNKLIRTAPERKFSKESWLMGLDKILVFNLIKKDTLFMKELLKTTSTTDGESPKNMRGNGWMA